MSMIQSVVFSSVRWTESERVLMHHPKTTFDSSRRPSALCFVILIIGSRVHWSWGSAGRKRVSRIRGTACLIRSGRSSLSTHACMKSSIKLSVTISRAGRSTRRASAGRNGASAGSRWGGKSSSNGDRRSFGDQDGSRQRLFAISAVASLTQLNFVGPGEAPNGTLVRRYAMSLRVVIHVTAADILV
jgi:hypothetical protein